MNKHFYLLYAVPTSDLGVEQEEVMMALTDVGGDFNLRGLCRDDLRVCQVSPHNMRQISCCGTSVFTGTPSTGSLPFYREIWRYIDCRQRMSKTQDLFSLSAGSNL